MHTHMYTEQGPHQVPPADPIPLVCASNSLQLYETVHKYTKKGLHLLVPPTHSIWFCTSPPRNETLHEQGIHQALDNTPLMLTPGPTPACDGPLRHVQEIPPANMLEFGLPTEQEAEKVHCDTMTKHSHVQGMPSHSQDDLCPLMPSL